MTPLVLSLLVAKSIPHLEKSALDIRLLESYSQQCQMSMIQKEFPLACYQEAKFLNENPASPTKDQQKRMFLLDEMCRKSANIGQIPDQALEHLSVLTPNCQKNVTLALCKKYYHAFAMQPDKAISKLIHSKLDCEALRSASP